MITLTIFILLIEALFFYIPLKEIKDIKTRKDKIKLYLLILLSNIISTMVFGTSIFRYILCFIIIYFFIKILKLNYYKENTLYDFFIIPTLFLLKMIIEYIVFFAIFNLVNYTVFVIVLETFCILFAFIFKNKLKIIYNKIKESWNGTKKFYYRYLFLIVFNTIIIFLIYNLIKIKEVF